MIDEPMYFPDDDAPLPIERQTVNEEDGGRRLSFNQDGELSYPWILQGGLGYDPRDGSVQPIIPL